MGNPAAGPGRVRTAGVGEGGTDVDGGGGGAAGSLRRRGHTCDCLS